MVNRESKHPRAWRLARVSVTPLFALVTLSLSAAGSVVDHERLSVINEQRVKSHSETGYN